VPHVADDTGGTLRERKRARTRQALVDAALDLFQRNGYERTTVADIAAAADVGARTFFSYFPSKEDLLFPEVDDRVRISVEAIDDRRPDERPVDVLLRGLRTAGERSDDLVGPLARLRLKLSRTVPAVRGRALVAQLDAQLTIARHLHAAYPDELDEVSATALVGALSGAVTGALQVLLADDADLVAASADPAELHTRLRAATELALRPWLTGGR
jgi:AcrR family transcriptional regulator